jgi:FixJ family two-component response regulator
MPNRHYSVAVVDDEEPVRRALTRLLRAAGMDSQAYSSAQEFLTLWRSRPPHCVVLDLQMPGLNGLELMQCLTQLGARLPIIIITAHDEPAMRARCLQAGAAAYLCKPLDDRTLLSAITHAQQSTGHC